MTLPLHIAELRQKLIHLGGPDEAKCNASEQEQAQFIKQIRFSSQDNLQCFDCSAGNPSWCTTTYAVFLCLKCSGQHRQKGSHLTFVRSTDLDRMTWAQLYRLAIGGNGRCRRYLRQECHQPSGRLDVYSDVAKTYKERLDQDSLDVFSGIVPTLDTTATETAALKLDDESVERGSPTTSPAPVVVAPSPLPSAPSAALVPEVKPPSISSRPLISSSGSRAVKKTRIPLAKSSMTVGADARDTPIRLGTTSSVQRTRGLGNENLERRSNTESMPSKPEPFCAPTSVVEAPSMPMKKSYQPPNGGPSSISSSDYFGTNQNNTYPNTSSGSNMMTAGTGVPNWDEVQIQSNLLAEQAKEYADILSHEGADLVNKGMSWMLDYLKQ